MIINDKILVKNYKCFDSSGGGFENFFPINVIIGKNNSGKSSLIDLVQYLIETHKNFIETGRDNSSSEVLIDHKLTEQEISTVFFPTTSSGGIPAKNHFEYGKTFIDKIYKYRLEETGVKVFVKLETKFVREAKNQIEKLANKIQKPFNNKFFCHITSERDIIPEPVNNEIKITPNGTGATNLVQQIINNTDRDSPLIEIELLKELNTIINPDIKFSRILVQLNNNNYWEIFFEVTNKKRIALSKMGSGIKTVLLVLLNLIVRPVFENINNNSCIFAFEELENNLHPSLQRRLYSYIKKYSKNHSSYFFLTTHSNVVIDAFCIYENAQIIHVVNDGEKSTSSTIFSYSDTKRVLKDLGIKASDLLQSNGVIWVEGPSDRNYLNKWIEILSPELKEGYNYSIMFYGGRLLANLSFDYEWFNSDVIPLLKINRNAFVIIDRDGNTDNTKLNDTKKRINNEIGNNNCWITEGREIENYLTDESISKWLFDKHPNEYNFVNDKNKKLEDNILKSNSKIKMKYHSSKTVYSAEIAEYIDMNSLNILDLREKLEHLINNINEWNST